MKTAIVLPPFLYKRCPLIGLASLSAYLKRHGHEVEIFDLNAEMEVPDAGNEPAWGREEYVEEFFGERRSFFESQAERILSGGAGIIGFSMWHTTAAASMKLARMIRQKDKRRLIIAGGPECSFSPQKMLGDGAVDVIVKGEGEATVLEIVRGYEADGKIGSWAGTAARIDGTIRDCGERPEIKELEALPFPDFSGFPLERYFLKNTLPIMFNRGCLRNCVFCNTAVVWKTCRSRGARHIYEEMLFQKARHPGLAQFEVDDAALNINLTELSALCDLIISGGPELCWGGSALIHGGMGYDLLEKMAKAGCRFLSYGLESGSQKVVDGMRKGFRMEDAQRLIRDTCRAGIKVLVNIVVGFPSETENDFRQTMEFLSRNREYIDTVAAPSECWIGNTSYLHRRPSEFNVRLGIFGDRWESADGLNNHEERQRRLKIFADFVNSSGLALQKSKLPEKAA